jgi:hypothetical protein
MAGSGGRKAGAGDGGRGPGRTGADARGAGDGQAAPRAAPGSVGGGSVWAACLPSPKASQGTALPTRSLSKHSPPAHSPQHLGTQPPPAPFTPRCAARRARVTRAPRPCHPCPASESPAPSHPRQGTLTHPPIHPPLHSPTSTLWRTLAHFGVPSHPPARDPARPGPLPFGPQSPAEKEGAWAPRTRIDPVSSPRTRIAAAPRVRPVRSCAGWGAVGRGGGRWLGLVRPGLWARRQCRCCGRPTLGVGCARTPASPPRRPAPRG